MHDVIRRWVVATVVTAAVTLVGCGGGAKEPPPREHDPMYKVRLAQSLMRGGRVSEALETLEEAIEQAPDNASIRLTFGVYNFQAGRYLRAEQAFLESLELDPYLTDARNYLGTVYQELGRQADAEAQYRRALEDRAYPTPEKIYFNLALLYAGQGKDVDAVGNLRRSVEINPKYYKAHFELAVLLESGGKLDEAAREYEVAEPEYRNQGEYHYRLGMTYFRLDEKIKAREHLQRVLDIAPGSPSSAKADELLQMLD